MAKIFRLHKGDNTIEDWQESGCINSTQINAITDPDGATSKKEITSIPSPFARIDLTLSAFKEVNRIGLDGQTIFHKTVSDSLDIGEIFFNIRRFSDKFKIISWDKNIHIKELLDSQNKEHNIVGKTLEMYMSQDANNYNFGKLNCIYLLNYVGDDAPSTMNIVGATSPCTMFFSTANNLDYVSKNIAFGADKPFDNYYMPLYKRDFEYFKYLWLFKLNYNNFANDFKVINAYIDENFKLLSDAQKNILRNISSSDINQYSCIQTSGSNVEILGQVFNQRIVNTNFNSDFKIKSTVNTTSKAPLVLPVESGNKYTSLLYVTAKWTNTAKAPIQDNIAIHKRKLPIVGDDYPYLTISDFLSDTLVRMPFDMDTEHYFDAYLASENGSYLLPLTEIFFRYFTVEELQNELVDGERMFEMCENAGGITAILRIPIIGNNIVKFIEYKRNYIDAKNVDFENSGRIIDKEFGLGIFPFMKFKTGITPHYRIPLFDKWNKDVNLVFENEINTIDLPSTNKVSRRSKGDGYCSIETYVLSDNFDRIQVNIGNNIKAYVVPRKDKFKEYSGTSEFTFAVDFGTSNTHIEYSKDKGGPKAFDICANDQQMVRLHRNYKKTAPDINAAFLDSYTPEYVGGDSHYSFPLRTAFAEYKNINYKTTTHALASTNLSFTYGKGSFPLYNKISTDLKWAADKEDQLKHILENLYILMRNKVLANGGDLDKTKIIWFYPASMTEAHFNRFNNLWKTLFSTYIGNKNSNNLIAMSESTAPYSYCKKKVGAKSNAVSIDIGGETTDVYMVQNNEPIALTSFRFASNAIFGDAYGLDSDNNGYVKLYNQNFRNILNENNLGALSAALQDIANNKVSSDIISFYFSLYNNKEIMEKKLDALNFASVLTNNSQLKYCFIIYYSAIIYHIAQLMKAKGFEKPLTLAFSGNGSRSINILSSNKKTLQNYFKLIIESVFNSKYDIKNDFEIVLVDNPKIITCKGGILNQQDQDFDNIDNLKCALIGIDNTTLTDSNTQCKIDSSTEKNVVTQVEEFIDFMFNINEGNNNLFVFKFDCDPNILNYIKSVTTQNLREYIKDGINQYKEEYAKFGGDSSTIEINSTLFFFPIIGMLNNITNKIADKDYENK